MSIDILVVDDDAPTLELMGEILLNFGVETQAIIDPQEAAGLIENKKFDGIFLDLEMPKLDGFQLTRLIRQSERNQKTPIIIVSGRDKDQTVEQALKAGATFFLQKPLTRAKFIDLLNKTRGTILNDRRRTLRVSGNKVSSAVHCTNETTKISGTIINLSQGGIFIEANEVVPEGSPVELQFRLPGHTQDISASGIVRGVRDHRFHAIQFTEIKGEGAKQIAQLIRSEVVA